MALSASVPKRRIAALVDPRNFVFGAWKLTIRDELLTFKKLAYKGYMKGM
jgi:hypothetical protein